MGGVLASTAWAADNGGNGTVSAAAENPEVRLSTVLSGANEIPAADPDGMGAATFTLNKLTGQVCVVAVTENIEPIAMAHIHTGAAGANGAIVVNLSPASPTDQYALCATATPAIAQDIAANPAAYYYNVHTQTYPNGAMRGQLALAASSVGNLSLLPEPVRVYDSRTTTQGALAIDTTRTVDLSMGMLGSTMQLAVPPGATAAVVTLTVTQTGNAGYLRIYSNALIEQPQTSTINWFQPNSDIGTTTTVAVDASGDIKVSAGGSGTQFIVDVIGYYTQLDLSAAG